jgi:ssRNA-specific RNase YbeY (16S rRNA maturation enzyme)
MWLILNKEFYDADYSTNVLNINMKLMKIVP